MQVNGHVNGYHAFPIKLANGHVDSHIPTRMDTEKDVTVTEPDCYHTGTTGHQESIAICGMAMRLPGGINDAETFWDALFHGKDMRKEIPPERYNAKAFSSAMGKKGAIKTQHGYFLDDDLSHLDASFFSMTRSDLEKTDPQQRQVLEVTRECLENAGEVNWRGKPIGCYVGTFGEDWLHSMSKENQFTGAFSASGDLMLANRVSYEFDFKGPSMVIKTGCSASLVGLHNACRGLQSGDCSAAIVAGTSLIMGPYLTAAMTQQGVLSPEGSCKTFDAAADGFARAEAINAIYIKRLDDAISDGNPIRAIIRGTSTNSDGKSGSLMAPNGEAHETLMRKVYEEASLDPKETAFVECHGTGTATGDPIETTAVGKVFGEHGVLIGSVKPNIGHAEGASGINSLIKAVLALEHQIVPPNIKFTNPNPLIPFEEMRLQVPLKPTSWPRDRAQRISVNSFGIGGSNAHVIVDSAASHRAETVTTKQGLDLTPRLMVLSANTAESLQRQKDNYQIYIAVHPERASDLCYTLCQRREHLPHRTYFVIDGTSMSEVSPSAKIPATRLSATMVFSGQGAQWPEMGKALMQHDPRFQKDIQVMDEVLRGLKHPPKWTIEAELQKPAKTSQINRAEFPQPLCTAIQIALVNALARGGVRPSAVIGHSSGEIAAAYAAGALSVEEAIIVAYYRGFIAQQQHLAGGMAAIGLDSKTVSQFLQDGVVIACENSPSSTTISGDIDKLEKVVELIKTQKPDVMIRQLKVDMAYHSHHMQPLVKTYVGLIQQELAARSIARTDPEIPLFSSVIDYEIDNLVFLGPKYWGSNLTSPVRFQSAVSRLLRHHPQTIFLEIGPHSTLAGPLRQICSEARAPCRYTPTMLRSNQSTGAFLSAIGQLYQHGVDIDFRGLIPTGKVLTDLPAYPWDHAASFWYETRVSKDWRNRLFGHHALLGQRVPESTTNDPCWRVLIDLEDEPFLYDHKVRDDIVFPFAGYVTMAGEAIRQITGIETGYSVRHVVAHTALVLTESKPVEVVTALRRHKLTDSTDADFYDFVISSYSGSTWIKNCEGRVKPLAENVPSSSRFDSLPRQIPAAKWYEIMAHVGLVYGPEFKGLTNLTASATEPSAVAVIKNSPGLQEAPYLFHPAAIDSCLQLVLTAMAQAAGRNFTQLCVPTLIEELDVSRSALSMDAKAWCSGDKGDVGLDCVADDRVVLRLRGARMTPLEDGKAIAPTDRYAAARLEWFPDFDFMDVPPLFTAPVATNDIKLLLEELALLCLLDSAERLEGLSTEIPHFRKFRDWLQREKHRAVTGTYPVVKDAADYTKLSRPVRLEGIRVRMAKLSNAPSIGLVAQGIMRICENAEGLYTGEVDTLDILMRDNILTEIYNAVSFGFGDFVRLLAITKPNLRILEVGAGTGGTTELILRDLARRGGNPSYSVYTFTDISAGFFTQARERFSYAPNMEYKVLDISKDALEQGFEAQSYDLILAPNVIHATPSLQESLRTLRPLLRPHGHLVLSEVCAVARAPGYVFGNFSGWWLGEADDREWQPYVMPDRWDRELKQAGYTGADTVVHDADEPFQYCAAIVASPQAQDSTAGDRAISLLCDRPDEGISQRLVEYTRQAGLDVSISRLGDSLPGDRDVISTLDLETRFFENITAARFKAFQDLLRHHSSQKFLWLMPPTQIDCADPRSAQTIGAFRVARAELAIPLSTLEISSEEANFAQLVMKVFDKIRTREDMDKIAPDREYAVDHGVIKIGRYQPFSLEEEIAKKSSIGATPAKALRITKPGLLNTLCWEDKILPASLEDNQVEVATRAVGLNFRVRLLLEILTQFLIISLIALQDIMVAMGVLTFGSKSVPLGLELAGVVSRIGSKVRNVSVGDRVVGVAVEGCFATHALLVDSLVATIPDALGFEEAATMPACYTTAVQALIDVGRLEKGQTVLIHSACGGVGQAAIQLCKNIGATIYATVGSKEKRKYLIEKDGIPENRIFNSRNTSFLQAVMRETSGRGVDLVLNSLSGDLLHASWNCVAEFGKMVELGKRDLVGFGRLDLEPLLANRSYCCVDLAHAMKERPESVGRIIRRWINMYSQKQISPISQMAVFDASNIESSFRHLQKGDHIGKAVVCIPKELREIPSTPSAKQFTLDADASYLLTGGLGGLGRSVASWMVESGARHLTFLSRGAGKSDVDRSFFTELESMGCSVTAVTGKAEDMAAVEKARLALRKPIKGIVHLAMVLRDAPFLDLTHEGWTSAVDPKVEGAWNLHEAFQSESLDFFIMASSLVTLIDQPGQGNYAAANTFLESFCQYRRKLGLPASVLSVCPIDDIGFVADNPAIKKKLKSQGLYFLPERELLDYMELAVLNSFAESSGRAIPSADDDPAAPWKSSGHIIMGLRSEVHLEDASCQTSWRRDRRMGTYHNVPREAIVESSAISSNSLKVFMSRAANDPAILDEKESTDYLADEIGRRIFRFMMKSEEDMDIGMSLTGIGMDSLMAIELRRWWKQAFGLDISVLKIMGSGTLATLGKMAGERLKGKFEGTEK
ncbi:MAG: hypothetical protein Q9181_002526 [Wetmoreana brouardii]